MKSQQPVLEFCLAMASGLAAFSAAAQAGVNLQSALLAGVFGFIAGFLFAERQEQKRAMRWAR